MKRVFSEPLCAQIMRRVFVGCAQIYEAYTKEWYAGEVRVCQTKTKAKMGIKEVGVL